MLTVVEDTLKNKWLILNLVAECLYLCVHSRWNLINVYYKLQLVISTFSLIQQFHFFSFCLIWLFAWLCKKKTLYLFPHFSHLSNLHCHHVFLHIYFFLLVVEIAVNMESLSMSSKSCYLSLSLGPYAPTRWYKGSTENAVYTILN